ncbi:unnamed protein product [Chondrus crispus]|uniref:PUA domain-containing protein n=1 Tax=Chondrus crispus TaxID=2769 RepID=R7QQ92_CHOCR|nr:unnamed protein product [Chondrus crispus]CDF40667.1 unnamed protein product [Chondrus crispus]|eukprot:XP_005710961.1 unnamed protein product [Chondrus crispus]
MVKKTAHDDPNSKTTTHPISPLFALTFTRKQTHRRPPSTSSQLLPPPPKMLAFVFESSPITSFRGAQLPTRLSKCPPRRSYSACRVVTAKAQVTSPAVQEGRNHNASIDKLLDAGLSVVVLKRGKANLFRDQRNPMVFAGSVERHIPLPGHTLSDCDPVAVCNGAYACLGYGFFNPHSMFRVRMLKHVAPSDELDPPLPWDYAAEIVARMRNAVALREAIALPGEATNIYRVVNGEGDRLSGLVVDRVADTLVVSSSALWCEKHKDRIIGGLNAVLPSCADIVWRRNVDRLRQDGLADEAEHPAPLNGASTSPTDCDVKYELSRFALTRGQKTGHYADQRENRAFIRNLVNQRGGSKRVLDLFCYTGGFAMNAALGSDDCSVVAIDSSGRAIEMGQRNAELNGVSDKITFVQSDVIKYLRSAEEDQGSFDVVIVDPPKYAPNVKALPRATHKYRSLNLAAMRMVKQGGLLCTCSCSAAMTQNRHLFVEVIREAASSLGREVTLLKTVGAASDHPVTPEMPESEYLTMCVFLCR